MKKPPVVKPVRMGKASKPILPGEMRPGRPPSPKLPKPKRIPKSKLPGGSPKRTGVIINVRPKRK